MRFLSLGAASIAMLVLNFASVLGPYTVEIFAANALFFLVSPMLVKE